VSKFHRKVKVSRPTVNPSAKYKQFMKR
jgi:hypothetical protein